MNHYTTIKRKADLALQLGLTERQVSVRRVHLSLKNILKLLRGIDRSTYSHLFADKDLVSKPTGEAAEAGEKAARANKRAADEIARRCGGSSQLIGGGGGGGWWNDGLCCQRNGDGWDAGRTPRWSDAGQREHHLRAAFSDADHVDVSTHVYTFTHVSAHVAAYVAVHDAAYAIPGSF